jgi:hypothetical protein
MRLIHADGIASMVSGSSSRPYCQTPTSRIGIKCWRIRGGGSEYPEFPEPRDEATTEIQERSLSLNASNSNGVGDDSLQHQKTDIDKISEWNERILQIQADALKAERYLKAVSDDIDHLAAKLNDTKDGSTPALEAKDAIETGIKNNNILKKEENIFDDSSIIDRSTIRLDGLEVYAVVSALTVASSIQGYELLSRNWHWGASNFVVDTNNRFKWYCELAVDLFCLVASATGMIAGLHSTVVFSLVTVYGRTAIGMGADHAFEEFFHKTAKVRYRAFLSFRMALYSFLVEALFLIKGHLPPYLRSLGVAIVLAIIVRIYSDTQSIIDQAGIILFSNNSLQGPVCMKRD